MQLVNRWNMLAKDVRDRCLQRVDGNHDRICAHPGQSAGVYWPATSVRTNVAVSYSQNVPLSYNLLLPHTNPHLLSHLSKSLVGHPSPHRHCPQPAGQISVRFVQSTICWRPQDCSAAICKACPGCLDNSIIFRAEERLIICTELRDPTHLTLSPLLPVLL